MSTIHIMDNALFRLAKPEYKKPKPGTIIHIMDDAIENKSTALSLYSLFSVKIFRLLNIQESSMELIFFYSFICPRGHQSRFWKSLAPLKAFLETLLVFAAAATGIPSRKWLYWWVSVFLHNDSKCSSLAQRATLLPNSLAVRFEAGAWYLTCCKSMPRIREYLLLKECHE